MTKIKCKNCGNVAELKEGVCSKCEVKADYVVLEQVKKVVKVEKKSKKKETK